MRNLGLVGAVAIGLLLLGGAYQTGRADPNMSRLTPELQKPRQAKLEALFRRLKASPDQASGNAVVRQIWGTWLKTGNADLDALMRQAQIAMREGGFQEAFGTLDRIIATAPNYAEGWNKRATLNYMMGRHAESVRDIQKTLELEPRHFGALSGLGMIYMSRKNWSAALKAFEKAADVNPWLNNKDGLLTMLRKRAAGQSL